MTNLALLRRVMGDPAAAREIDEQALRGLTARLGNDHHFTLTAAMSLASDLAVLGLSEEARRLGEDTWPRLTRLRGATHAHTLGCAANLALDRIAVGDIDGGTSLREETLRRYEEAYGQEFPDLIAAAEGKRLEPDFDPPAI